MLNYLIFLASALIFISIPYFSELLYTESYETTLTLSKDQVYLDFNEWKDTIGIFTSGIEIKSSPEGIQGLYATEKLHKNKLIAEIPLKAMITEDFLSDDPIITKAKKKLTDNKLLAVILYKEMNNPMSKFKSYFDLYPEDLSTFPLFYGKNETKLINGTGLNLQIKENKMSKRRLKAMV